MSQYETIISAMLNNKNKVWWTAADFQQGEYFVGYEATARMSELKTKYLGLFSEKKIGRFRALRGKVSSSLTEDSEGEYDAVAYDSTQESRGRRSGKTLLYI